MYVPSRYILHLLSGGVLVNLHLFMRIQANILKIYNLLCDMGLLVHTYVL